MQLLREEMRRVLRFLKWKSEWWKARAGECRGDSRVSAGKKAYAAKQASILLAKRRAYESAWTGDVKVGQEGNSGKDRTLPDGVIQLEEQVYESVPIG